MGGKTKMGGVSGEDTKQILTRKKGPAPHEVTNREEKTPLVL